MWSLAVALIYREKGGLKTKNFCPWLDGKERQGLGGDTPESIGVGRRVGGTATISPWRPTRQGGGGPWQYSFGGGHTRRPVWLGRLQIHRPFWEIP
jgi:hypothetical protein